MSSSAKLQYVQVNSDVVYQMKDSLLILEHAHYSLKMTMKKLINEIAYTSPNTIEIMEEELKTLEQEIYSLKRKLYIH